MLEPQRELRKKLVQYGNYLELRQVLTGKIKIGKCFMEGIIDTGGSKALMPLKVALHNFRDLVEPITEIVESGTNFTGKEVQDVLKLMKVKWKVGVTDNHVEQAHIERCFRELNSHL